MFSSQISKHEMEFHLEAIYWENTLFLEISMLINHHFNVLSEEEKMGSAAFSWRSDIMSFPPSPIRPLCR